MSNNRPIGVFDSGMGGLTVLAELVRLMPHEDFIYLGDTARVPYGSKSPRVVERYSQEVADHLLKSEIKHLVIACNTATAHAEESLTQRLPIGVTGVIKPGVEALLKATGNNRLGVIGTRSTIKSEAYQKALAKKNPDVTLFSRACPLFVPLVEEGWVDKNLTTMVIREYLSEIVREGVDTLLLGCTHYPLLKKSIQLEFPEIRIIDSSVVTAQAVKSDIYQGGLENRNETGGRVQIQLTDISDQIERLEQLFYGNLFDSVQEVQL